MIIEYRQKYLPEIKDSLRVVAHEKEQPASCRDPDGTTRSGTVGSLLKLLFLSL